MRKKLEIEIRSLVNEILERGLSSREISHEVGHNLGGWTSWLTAKTFPLTDVLDAILRHCELELDYMPGSSDRIVINTVKKKKEKAIEEASSGKP